MRLQAMLGAMLLLAACSGGEPAGGEDIAAPAADIVPAALPPAPAKAPPPMGPAPGKWRFTTTTQGLPGGSITSEPREDCLRDQIDLREAHMRQSPAGITCADHAFRQEGTSVIGSYTCTMADGSKAQVEATTSGDMMRAYTSTIVNTLENPPPGMPASTTMMIVAERVGDCSAPPPPLFLDLPAQ